MPKGEAEDDAAWYPPACRQRPNPDKQARCHDPRPNIFRKFLHIS